MWLLRGTNYFRGLFIHQTGELVKVQTITQQLRKFRWNFINDKNNYFNHLS